MFKIIAQPKNFEEARFLIALLKKKNVLIASDSIRYALPYCDYSSWPEKWSTIAISTNYKNETWTAKSTGLVKL